MIKIDKNVPVPRKPASGIYPWHDLQPGDSFFAAGIKQPQISGATAFIRKKTGRKFVTRTVTENGVTGVRVWRVE